MVLLERVPERSGGRGSGRVARAVKVGHYSLTVKTGDSQSVWRLITYRKWNAIFEITVSSWIGTYNNTMLVPDVRLIWLVTQNEFCLEWKMLLLLVFFVCVTRQSDRF